MKSGGEVLSAPHEMLHTMEDVLALVERLKSYDEEARIVLESTGSYHWPVVKGGVSPLRPPGVSPPRRFAALSLFGAYGYFTKDMGKVKRMENRQAGVKTGPPVCICCGCFFVSALAEMMMSPAKIRW